MFINSYKHPVKNQNKYTRGLLTITAHQKDPPPFTKLEPKELSKETRQ